MRAMNLSRRLVDAVGLVEVLLVVSVRVDESESTLSVGPASAGDVGAETKVCTVLDATDACWSWERFPTGTSRKTNSIFSMKQEGGECSSSSEFVLNLSK